MLHGYKNDVHKIYTKQSLIQNTNRRSLSWHFNARWWVEWQVSCSRPAKNHISIFIAIAFIPQIYHSRVLEIGLTPFSGGVFGLASHFFCLGWCQKYRGFFVIVGFCDHQLKATSANREPPRKWSPDRCEQCTACNYAKSFFFFIFAVTRKHASVGIF